jgi:RNA polymerase sigma factor (sigma-70 family)
MPADLPPEAPPVVRGVALPADVLAHLGEQLARAFQPSEGTALPGSFVAPLARLEQALASVAAAQPAAAEALRDALLAAVPGLRTFAFSLTRDADRADDLVQDTLVRAWAKADSFTPGTNLTAWLFTILRNLFYSEQRKRKREVEDADGKRAERLISLPDQNTRADLADFRTALVRLPAPQQEALMLIGAHGLSYEEAAEIVGVAIGTVKSRVNRARTRLVELLGMDGTGDIGDDAVTRAAGAGVSG